MLDLALTSTCLSLIRALLFSAIHSFLRLVLEYDTQTHDLKTVSMHSFEDMHEGTLTSHVKPRVFIDPNRRYAVLSDIN